MSSSPEGNRFAPPQAHVENKGLDERQLAGRGARLGAAILDGLALALIVGVLVGLGSAIGGRGSDTSVYVSLFIAFVAFAVINGWLLARRGQTIGKAALGLRIVRSNGEEAGLGRLLGLRYGIGWALGMVPVLGPIYGLVDSLMIFRASRQCLHDNIADTIVIKP